MARQILGSSGGRRGSWDRGGWPRSSEAVSRIVGACFRPGLFVLALLGAALAVPLFEESSEPGPTSEVLLDGLVTQVLFAPDGRGIFVDQGISGPVRMEVDGIGLSPGTTGRGLMCVRMAIDPGGVGLVLALNDGSFRVVDPSTLEVLREMAGHDDRVQGLSISSDGATLVSVDCAGVVKVWDLATGALLRRFSVDFQVTAGVLSPDGNRIALGGLDGRIAVIDARSGALEASWEGHGLGTERATLDLQFSPGGDELASVGLDSRVRFWDVADDWALRREIEMWCGVSPCVAYSEDGRSVATGHSDGRVRLWDVANGGLLSAEPISTMQVTAIAFEPGGGRLAASSGLGVAILDIPVVSRDA